MTGTDPEDAARDLAHAERGLRRGAELIVRKPLWWYPAVCLSFAGWGASHDIPRPWRGLVQLLWVAMYLGLVFAGMGRARPLPVKLGWRTWSLVIAGSAVAIAVTIGLGRGLRALDVPLPHTLSGLLLGIVAALVAWRAPWSRISYIQRVTRGQW